MSKGKTMVITGASGFIGQALQAHFHAQGWKIIVLGRNEPEQKMPGVLYQYFDLLSPRLESDTFKGVDVFIHAAYVKAEKGVDAFAINTKASRQLHESALRQHTGRQIFISSLSAKKDALSEYGRQKYAIEEIFSDPSSTVIRPGLVLGHGGLFGRMSEHIRKGGKIPLIGGGQQPLQTVHVDDLVAAIDKIITGNLPGKFTVAEPEAVSYRRFYETLCQVLHKKPRFKFATYGIVGITIKTAELFGMRLPVNRDNLLGLKSLEFVDSKASLTQLGMQIRNYEKSLRDLADGSA